MARVHRRRYLGSSRWSARIAQAALGISYRVSKYFVAASSARFRSARIAFLAQRDPRLKTSFQIAIPMKRLLLITTENNFGACAGIAARSAEMATDANPSVAACCRVVASQSNTQLIDIIIL